VNLLFVLNESWYTKLDTFTGVIASICSSTSSGFVAVRELRCGDSNRLFDAKLPETQI